MAKSKATAAPAPTPAPTPTNHTLTLRRTHPGNRVSYGVAGVPGLVVVDLKLFADGKPPATITVDCALAVPAESVAKPKATAA